MGKFDCFVQACGELLRFHPIGSSARTYLESRLPTSAWDRFGFGFHPPQDKLNILFSFCNKDQMFEDLLLYRERVNGERAELVGAPLQNHNLILPYRDVYGNIVALVGRSLLDEDERSQLGVAKYKNTAFKKSRHLFGLFEAKQEIIKKNYVYIVEGQFDAISCHSYGLSNVVALGSSNFSDEQVALLLRYTNNFRLLLDNDEAGETGRKRAIEKYSKYLNITNYYVPTGFKDVDDFINETSQTGIKISDIENSLKN